jgi:hypothetical protein
VIAAGCRRTPEPTPARRFVRLEALLPLHPAWAQVAALDRVLAEFASHKTQPALLPLTPPPFPPPFPPPKEVPETLAKERQQRIEEDAARYVDLLESALRARADEEYRRQARVLQREMDATLAKELAQREEEIRAANQLKARAIDLQVRRLAFRVIALQSQIDVFRGQPREDAQLQMSQVLAETARLHLEREALLDKENIRLQAERDLEPRKQQLMAERDQRLKELRDRLDQEIADQLANAETQLEQQTGAIPPLGSAPTRPPDPRATPLTLLNPPGLSGITAAAQSDRNRVLARQRAEWQSYRTRLVNAIRADTQKAVEQAARQQGWQLVSEASRRAGDADGTEAATRALRRQWRQGASP